MITWFPTLYKTWFNLSLDTSLAYGWITSSCGVVASVICALMIDRVGRKRWYTWAFLLAIVPLITLSVLGAKSAVEILILGSLTYAILQTIAFSLYLYAAELYPHPTARYRHRVFQRMAPGGVIHRPTDGRFYRQRLRDPLCVYHFRGHCADWWLNYLAFCH
ncbi:transporter [Klebsiella michiganensis]|uniref:Transporter n=1 Tax=Klebsiella michiganensis TaxID=1134687 RepID=A0A7H4N6T1_9ENTR|nr:transporter [Klebsiella michiganensis]